MKVGPVPSTNAFPPDATTMLFSGSLFIVCTRSFVTHHGRKE